MLPSEIVSNTKAFCFSRLAAVKVNVASFPLEPISALDIVTVSPTSYPSPSSVTIIDVICPCTFVLPTVRVKSPLTVPSKPVDCKVASVITNVSPTS